MWLVAYSGLSLVDIMKKLNAKTLRVAGLAEARELVNDYDYIISIQGPGDTTHLRGVLNSLWLQFHDISFEAAYYVPPHPGHLIEVHNFYDAFVNDSAATTLMVHCHAGISRSAAIAFYCLLLDGYSREEARELLLSIRPEASPNLMLMGYMNEEFPIIEGTSHG